MTTSEDLTTVAERRWLDGWTRGPTEPEGHGLPTDSRAPDLTLLDDRGAMRSLAEFWDEQPALLMFWRHFGCGCGAERASRLRDEYASYRDAGLNPVIVAMGEPARAASYRAARELPCPVLCDPDLRAYRAYGIGQWPVERILFDAPSAYWSHPAALGASFQDGRRATGWAPVDDPWRAVAEFVIGQDGRVRLCWAYQSCEDFPDPRVLTTAARLSAARGSTPEVWATTSGLP